MAITRPENRTEFLQAFREQADFNFSAGNSKIANRNQLERFLDMALNAYSIRRPVEGLSATLTITSGDSDVALPNDWLIGYMANERILQAIERGEDPKDLEADYSSLYFENQSRYPGRQYNLSWGNSFDPINQTLSRPIRSPQPKQLRPTITKKWVNGVLIPVWVQRRATLPSDEIQVNYFGRHQIEDGTEETDSINTLYDQDEHIIYSLMSVLCAKGKAFREDSDTIAILQKTQTEFNAILASITPVSQRKR